MKVHSKFLNTLYVSILKNQNLFFIAFIFCFIFCIGCYSCIQTVVHLGANFSLLAYLSFFLTVALIGYFFTRLLRIDTNLIVQILLIFVIYFVIVTILFLYSHKDNFATIFRLPPGFESIDPGPVEGKQFFFDGHADFWAFVLYRDGIINDTIIDRIGMEEKTAFLYSILYSLMNGDNQFYIISFLMFTKLFTVFVVVHFLKEYLNPKHLFLLMFMIFIMPDELVATHLGHKDVIVTFLIFITFYLNFNVLKEFKIIKLLILLLTLIIIIFVRSGIILIVEFLIFLTLFLWHKEKSKVTISFIFLNLCIFVLLLSLSDSLKGHFERKIFQKLFDKILIGDGAGHGNPLYMQDYFIYRNNSITKKYFSNINIYNIHLLPLKSFAYLISPFPLHRFEFRWNWLISIGTLINIFSIPFFTVGVFYAFKNKNKNFLFSIIYCIFLSLAIAMAGPFIHERYRIMILPLFYSISVYGSSLSTVRHRAYLFGIGGILLIFLHLIYYILKDMTLK
ncbi:putative membrane protein [Leptospira santarosai str. 2000027870]|uniref:hypothetical protein n=1 Tax=Leptospira santarosai TaxID=28183 RepID=UPI0002BE106C|nr:hypothetical protein [Leptospira santarosai]EMM85501.1 putative membrane protein [Leptospira santarosai str. 2000027870]